ncbi:enoyl-CoA hydratase [Burkholderia sp. SG-MS1]|uniref:enoyl-CoA hydratase/isomerase family protein n=1 Tax=Paraburkholderia sp. SG-MS1 TaxID=2023741 RepID=UPI0014450362|nr:enoyl-CoA hydratase/isomerase family protein [Paraburkholderia sp. SG-MS1]NKJ48515.1 enoyl-CoA hydratase [Paraburkholderia sp. SG-MS1]
MNEHGEAAAASVLSVVRAGVLHVTINRPDKRNALNRATLDALRSAFDDAAQDAALHLVVLSGAGERSFAAGGDLREFDSLRSEADAIALFDHAAATLDAIRATPVPVIAALNGTALGGGAELAMACDYRVAASHACMGFVQATLAITTGFSGAADLFPLLGSARAMRLLAAADVLSAQDACALGLIDAVCNKGESLDERVAQFALPFIERAPHVVRAIKRLGTSHRKLAREATGAEERAAFVATWTAPEHWKAARKFLDRRRAET